MSSRYDQIVKLDEGIFNALDEDDIDNEIETTTEYLTVYNDMKTKAELALSKSKKTNVVNNTSSMSTPSVNAASNVRLPKISLPIFDGDTIHWMSFWQSFEGAVHKNETLNGANKFEYLSAQLQGEAATLVQGFEHTAEAYEEVVQLLQKTYGDKQKIVRSHLYKIFDIRAPNSNSKDLMTFRNEYEGHLRSLKVLGINVEAASHVYTALLTRKLPFQIRDNINRATRKNYLELDELRTAIDEEIERLNISDSDKDHRARPSYEHETTTSNFYATTSQKIVCHYCGQEHKAIECHVYPTVEERQRIIKSRRLCFNCLSPTHRVEQCRSLRTCMICKANHHTSICATERPVHRNSNQAGRGVQINPQTTSNPQRRNIGETISPHQFSPTNQTTSTNLIHGVTSTILPTAMVGVAAHDSVYYLRTLFDQGAQRSFVLKKSAEDLQLQIHGKTEMTINGFNTKGKSQLYDVTTLNTVTNEGYISVNAIVVDVLPGNITMNGRSQVVRNIQLKGIALADPTCDDSISSIQLIVGADHYFDFVYNEKIDDVALIPSKLGYLISGRTPINDSDNSRNTSGTSLVTSLHVGASETEDDLNENLSRLWSLDTIGIQQDTLSNGEIAAVENFESNITYTGKCYIAGLPWKADHPPLPTNEGLARKRLQSTLRRLRRTPDILEHYDKVIQTHIDKEFVETVNETTGNVDNARIHYLSHHEVKKDSPTTPIRVVFDCSAKISPSQPSLNDCLLTGPSLVHELGRMLLLFRLEPYAAIADIEKAFLQVGLRDADRDSTRFLWPDNPHDPNSEIRIYRFRVVLFGATCSQFLLNATLRHHLRLNASEVAHKLLERLYVDNLQTSEKSQNAIVNFYDESRQLLKDAGFILREWHTNSPQLSSIIKQNGDGISGTSEERDDVPLLGMRWKSGSDEMSFSDREVEHNNSDITITKRYVVSQASKVFDPLGWLTPVTITSRIFIQKLWKLDIEWDEPLNDELVTEWLTIESDLLATTSTAQKREIMITDKTELHCFCDASMKAYGAVIYLVTDGYVQLLISKSRVTPIRKITLPQLELTAANVAAKLVNYVLETYKEQTISKCNVHMWSDSEIVLCWLKSDKPMKTYVRNRVDEINHLLPKSTTWAHVATKDNPADLLSRGMTYRAYDSSTLWWQGPLWL